jgi:hypothetical protein
MPENQASLIRPSIIVSAGTSEAVQKRIDFIDDRIHANPEEFLALLGQLGETATSRTVELKDRDNGVRHISGESEELIDELFTERYDLDFDYDEATQARIAGDATHQNLLAELRSKKPDHIQTGKMSSENRPNADANSIRDSVRRASFGIYLGRVADEHRTLQQLDSQNETAFQAAGADLRAMG